MNFFDHVVEKLIEIEGGFCNNPSDSGGATKFGISNRFLSIVCSEDKNMLAKFDKNQDGFIDKEDIKNISKEDACYLYKVFFWDKYKFHLLPICSLTQKVFETCVNTGVVAAIKSLQSAINKQLDLKNKLSVDGIIGEKTAIAMNSLLCKEREIMQDFIQISIAHYRGIVKKIPKNATFLNGWINRLIL